MTRSLGAEIMGGSNTTHIEIIIMPNLGLIDPSQRSVGRFAMDFQHHDGRKAMTSAESKKASALTDAPRSYVASPDIYKIIAEGNNTRVILATWKPGQRDAWHSHPPAAVYCLTDCEAGRLYSPDGQFIEGPIRAGQAEIHPKVHSHSFENRSNADCRILFVEQG
jgi:hypothetical protein